MPFIRHRVLLIAGVLAAVVAVVVALRASSAPQGSTSLTWGAAPPASASPGPASAGGLPIPRASPSPAGATSPLGGLQIPLNALFTQLNSETRETAVGQYTMLNEIGDAIRDHVSAYLNSISAGR